MTEGGFLKAAERLQKRGALLNPRHGFYVVIPPQYRSWKAPPPSFYIDDLMRHEARSYYVGLLKAAELHGATHHAVMEFQVVTDKQLPKIRAGRSIIAFYYRKDFASVSAHLSSHKTDTGTMKISTPELTAFDMLRYAHVVGGIDAIATVLSDLKEKLDGQRLASLAPHMERAYVQRLGYLLERLDRADAAAPLHDYLGLKRFPWTELQPQSRKRGTPGPEPVEKNERWRVIVHRFPEIDE
ncbi:MAG: type IV toxin-antitoxin system AbiEi family antitoxin [Methylocystis sp.]